MRWLPIYHQLHWYSANPKPVLRTEYQPWLSTGFVCTSVRPLFPPIRLIHTDQWWMRLMDTRHCIILESKVQHKVKIALSEWVTCVAWALPLTRGPPSRVPCYNTLAVWSLVWVLGVYCSLVKYRYNRQYLSIHTLRNQRAKGTFICLNLHQFLIVFLILFILPSWIN